MPISNRFFALLISLFIGLHSLAAGDEIRLLSLYPVPLKTNRLFVRINYSLSGIHHLEVRNLIGKKIQEKPVPDGNGEISFDDLDHNPNGVYLVVAKNEKGKVLEIAKFILNK